MAHNTLKPQDRYALARWIDRNEEMLAAKGASYDDAAKMASAALGFAVTWANCRGAAKMAGSKWTGGKGGGLGKPGKQVRIVAEELIRVMNGLGIEPVEELVDIAKGGKSDQNT